MVFNISSQAFAQRENQVSLVWHKEKTGKQPLDFEIMIYEL